MGKGKKQIKKQTRQAVFAKLSGAMEEYKNEIKEKKLFSRLQKLSKRLAADIVKASARKNGKAKTEMQPILSEEMTPAT